MAAYGFAASSMRRCCARCWRRRDDRTAERGEHLAGVRGHRFAQWLRWIGGNRADETIRARLLGSVVRFSRSARRSDQAAVVGWGWSVSVLEAAGERPLRVAASDQRHCASDTGAAVDAARGDRLATTETHSRAAALG